MNESKKKYGTNRLEYRKKSGLLEAAKGLAKEPMVILLLVTSVIYFITGNVEDGIFLSVAIVLVSAIALFQDARSRRALEKLKDFTQASAKVIRDGRLQEIKSEDLVMGDCLLVEEGTSVPADAMLIQANDFSVNESILTGESMAVYKDETHENPAIYRGTTVASGSAIATVTAIGNETRLGKIGKSLETIPDEKTPLEIQINRFVKKMVVAGSAVFLVMWGINFFRTRDALDSLLKALTLAMSILPEEIPVAFTTFMALGAWRLMKMGIVVKQMKTVETLGSATVICTDKTGTLTENRMSLAKLFVKGAPDATIAAETSSPAEKDLIRWAMWASEPAPFDPMEIALHEAYAQTSPTDERSEYTLIHEYPLGGKPPMMTHVFENPAGQRLIAAKGAPEALMAVSRLTDAEKRQIEDNIRVLTADGYRVLGVGQTAFAGNDFPAQQQEFRFEFKGLVAFYDPPKKNIRTVLENFYSAGIAVKIVTGDNAATTEAIARQIGFRHPEKSITGDELMRLSETELQEKVMDTYLFSRMFPEAKLRIIDALKAQKQIVAMTGDGVNDGPALKAAHIGIAMGKKGTEIAKQAASLVLLEDDLSSMVNAVAMGRKIYANLKKAIRYIISIHIPIILTVFVPLALGWIYPNIFSPIHIILLELVMGPTCSIIYENEPMEANTMTQKPRPFTHTFFNVKELATSILQGMVITAGTLAMYRYAVHQGLGEALTRTLVFTTLISANLFLTLVNRSFYYSVFATLRYRNAGVWMIVGITVGIAALLLFVPPLTRFFGFERMDTFQLAMAVGLSFVSVVWYEVVKWVKRIRKK